jgi:hypothetical protein
MPTVPEFLQPLQSVTRPFPREALEAAIERREESIPHLLQVLVWVVRNPEEANDAKPVYMLHLFALYLLAQFRETRAFPWILQLFRLPLYETLTGDLATGGLAQILASTCGGDLAPIQALIEDQTADEWVRGAAVQALAVLVVQGLQPRELIARYYSDLFLSRLERVPGNVWDNLISVCTDLRMSEHLDAIRELYEQDIADPWHIELEVVEDEIKLPPGLSHYQARQYRLIDDTIAEMRFWYCFTPEAEKEDNRDPLDDVSLLGALEQDAATSDILDEEYEAPGLPVVRAAPKIGRNDPCPCASGLKYKKCCGKGG